MNDSEAIGASPGDVDSPRKGNETNANLTSPMEGFGQMRPAAIQGLKGFPVGDELVLVPDQGARVIALNSSGRAIWELCSGKQSLFQIHAKLNEKFSGSELEIFSDLSTALFQFNALELLEPASLRNPLQTTTNAIVSTPVSQDRPRVRIVHGIEDNAYFHWQLAIMFESLIGQMPSGWDVSIVVCNNHRPISAELQHILTTYSVDHYTGESHADNHHMDFAGGGDHYVPINRVEALNVMSNHVAPEDIVCLMDTDIFLYGELSEALFPTGNAMALNWIIGQDRYFQFAADEKAGLSLPKLLEAFGCETEFKPGGVMVFLTGETLQDNDRKVIRDCFRFLQILFLSGKILDLPEHGTWVSEMACFALAMYPNGIDYELLDIEQFAVQEQFADELPEGTFYHYYCDVNDTSGSLGPFHESRWHKQLFRDRNFLKSNIDSYLDVASGSAEKKFLNLAKQSRDRLYGDEIH